MFKEKDEEKRRTFKEKGEEKRRMFKEEEEVESKVKGNGSYSD